jgi:hypothetical protein
MLSEAKDLRSLPWLNGLRPTAEILRFAQDDTFRISSQSFRIQRELGPASVTTSGRKDAVAKCLYENLY